MWKFFSPLKQNSKDTLSTPLQNKNIPKLLQFPTKVPKLWNATYWDWWMTLDFSSRYSDSLAERSKVSTCSNHLWHLKSRESSVAAKMPCRKVSSPPVTLPLVVKVISRYLPKRLELLLMTVLALPNASTRGFTCRIRSSRLLLGACKPKQGYTYITQGWWLSKGLNFRAAENLWTEGVEKLYNHLPCLEE